jgi:hypothetical protein
MKNIRTFEGFVNESKTEEVVVDEKVKDILGKIFNKDKEFKAKYTDLDSCKKLVDEFIKGTTFKDLKGENFITIKLGRLLKKFDSKVKDTVLADITSNFKELNGDNTTVKLLKIIKK